jgi:hypothetical protein
MSNHLQTILLVAALALPVVFFPVAWRKSPRLGRSSLMAYLLSYLLFSLAGTYAVANHGGSDWTREWLPRGLMIEYHGACGRAKSDLTLVGAVYWPCILCDRLVWHRTTQVEV